MQSWTRREAIAPGYIAFISYKRGGLDERVALYLQRRLESYRVPRGLAASSAGARLGRVFIDRAEVSASPSLTDTLTRALTNSQHLIVVCSESTPGSPWVLKEIDVFLSLGRRERLLIVLAGDPAGPAPSALLAALHPGLAEPLAVDVRASGARRVRSAIRAELPRLIAPLIGCTFDDLRRREQTRQHRRIATVATASTVASCAFGLLAAYAFTQKRLSEQRLISALSTAEYISQVIERGLEPIPGTADLRRELLDSSQQLLSQLQSDAAANTRLVYDQFNEHMQRGDLASSHGNPPEARKEYEQAGRLIEMLARTAPNASIIGARALVRQRFGRTAYALGAYADAIGHYRSALALIEPIATESWRSRAVLVTTYQDISDCLKATADLDGASQYLELANDTLARRPAPDDPDDAEEYARLQYITLERIAELRAQTGQYSDALAANDASLAIKVRLRSVDPSNRHYLRDLGNGHELRGDYLSALGRTQEALGAHQESLTLRRTLLSMDPASVELATNVSISLLELASAQLELAMPREALARTTEAIPAIEAVLQRDRDAVHPRQVLATVLERHGDVLQELGDAAGARDAWQRSAAVRELLATQHPAVADFRRALSISIERLADSAAAAGQHNEASQHFQGMIRIREELVRHAPASLDFNDALANGLARAAFFHADANRQAEAARLWRRFRQVIAAMDGHGLRVDTHLRRYLAENAASERPATP